ncbi:MAG: hypothetical protein N3F62_00395 [Bacteroidia bacterium]|nr:hypothetical protein [Bacteroidia bacterium]
MKTNWLIFIFKKILLLVCIFIYHCLLSQSIDSTNKSLKFFHIQTNINTGLIFTSLTDKSQSYLYSYITPQGEKFFNSSVFRQVEIDYAMSYLFVNGGLKYQLVMGNYFKNIQLLACSFGFNLDINDKNNVSVYFGKYFWTKAAYLRTATVKYDFPTIDPNVHIKGEYTSSERVEGMGYLEVMYKTYPFKNPSLWIGVLMGQSLVNANLIAEPQYYIDTKNVTIEKSLFLNKILISFGYQIK